MQAPERFVDDLLGAVEHLLDHPDCNGQIGTVGFCLGGGLGGLLACDTGDVRATVVYYGTPPPAERAGSIASPMLGIYGGKDRAITDAGLILQIDEPNFLTAWMFYPDYTVPEYRVSASGTTSSPKTVPPTYFVKDGFLVKDKQVILFASARR